MEITWRISLVLLSLLLLESICKDVSGFQCTSDEHAPRISKARNTRIVRKQRSKNDEDFATSRIYVHPDPSVSLSTDFHYLYQNKSSPLWKAVETMSRALLVRRMTVNATIGPECDVFESGENVGACINGTSRQECRGYQIPDDLVGEQYVCNDENGTCGYEGEEGTGVEADFILIFAITNDSLCTEKDVLAFGAGCNDEEEYHRVVNGYINICPKHLKERDPLYRLDAFLYDLFLHQLTHVLGFAEEPIQNYSPDDDIPIIEVTYKGSKAKGLRTPKISQYAKEYFNCSDIDYVPLENEETQIAKLYHWDARVLNHEIMTGIYDSDYAVISNFTWHFFDDSQWYKVNYTFTNALQQYTLQWGKGEGCSFITESCQTSNKETYQYACEGTRQCTFDRLSKGNCENDLHFDGCSVVIASNDGACLFDVNYNSKSNETLDLIQSYGRLSRCFDVKISKDSNYYPACFETKIFLHTASGEYAYQIIGNQDYTDGEPVWCMEGKHIMVGASEVLCPPVQEILLLYHSSDYHYADDFVPPPLCDDSCLTCAAAHEADQCLSCHNGIKINEEFPSACNGYEVSFSQLASPSPSPMITTTRRPPIIDSLEIVLTILAGSIVVFVLVILLTLYFIIIIRLNLKKNRRKRRRHKNRAGASLAVSSKEIKYEEFTREITQEDKKDDDEEDESLFDPPPEEPAVIRTFSQDDPGVSTFTDERRSLESYEHIYDVPYEEINVENHETFSDEEIDGKGRNESNVEERDGGGRIENRDETKELEEVVIEQRPHDSEQSDRDGEGDNNESTTNSIEESEPNENEVHITDDVELKDQGPEDHITDDVELKEGSPEDHITDDVELKEESPEDHITDDVELNEGSPEVVDNDQRQFSESVNGTIDDDRLQDIDEDETASEIQQVNGKNECNHEVEDEKGEEELEEDIMENDEADMTTFNFIDQSLDEIQKSLEDIPEYIHDD